MSTTALSTKDLYTSPASSSAYDGFETGSTQICLSRVSGSGGILLGLLVEFDIASLRVIHVSFFSHSTPPQRMCLAFLSTCFYKTVFVSGSHVIAKQLG